MYTVHRMWNSSLKMGKRLTDTVLWLCWYFENAILTTVIKRSDTVQRAEQIENVRRRVFLGQAPAVVGGDSCGGGRGGGFALLVAHCGAQWTSTHWTVHQCTSFVHILSVHFSLQFTFDHLAVLFEMRLRPPLSPSSLLLLLSGNANDGRTVAYLQQKCC